MNEPDVSPLWYQVNENNELMAFSSQWDIDALANKVPKLLSRHLIGKHISIFISGDTTNMFTETMIHAARVRQIPLIKTYRCDSPTHKRTMQMTLTPFPDGSVRIAHQVVSESPWHHIRIISTARNPHRKVKRCSMCNNLLDGDEWITQDVFFERHPDRNAKTLAVFYGICPNCNSAPASSRT